MDNLPIEIIPFILQFLPINQITRLRRVSKKWRFIIDQDMKPKELTIFHKTNKWIDFETTRKYFYRLNLVELREDSFLRYGNFQRIESLSSYLDIDEMNIEVGDFYNLFTGLRKLKINHFSRLDDSEKIVEIDLKNLKHVEIVYTYVKIVLNTPQLERLKASSLNDIYLRFKKSLKRLKLKNYRLLGHELHTFQRILPKLVNLEKLSLDQDASGIINNDLLETKLVNLKELKITCSSVPHHQNSSNPYSELTYRRKGLNIYINGYLIDMYKSIVGDNHLYFSENDLNELKFVAKNYKVINKVKGKFTVNFNFLKEQFGDIPEDFHQKVKIDELKVKGILENLQENEGEFLRLLKESKVSIIHIGFTIFSPKFFDRLVAVGDEIRFIAFENTLESYIPENFKFIFKMKFLKQINFKKYYLSLDLVTKASKINYENFFRVNFVSFDGHQADFHFTMNICGYSLYFNHMHPNLIKADKKNFTDLNELEFLSFIEDCKKRRNDKKTRWEEVAFLIGKIRLDILCKDFMAKKCFRTLFISKKIFE